MTLEGLISNLANVLLEAFKGYHSMKMSLVSRLLEHAHVFVATHQRHITLNHSGKTKMYE